MRGSTGLLELTIRSWRSPPSSARAAADKSGMAIQEYQLPGWYKGAERRFSHQQRCARTSFTRRRCSHLRPRKIRANAIRVDVRDRGRGEPSLILLHYYGGRSEPGMRLSTDLWTSTDRSRSPTLAGA